MSHYIIKKIEIKDNKVFATGKCNNDTEPFKESEIPSLSEILQKEGLAEVEMEILRAYEDGNFQSRGEGNKYSRAIDNLRLMDEYTTQWSWRESTYKDDCPIFQNRHNEQKRGEFNALLIKAFMLPKLQKNVVVTKQNYGETIYVKAVTTRLIKFTNKLEEAKKFTEQSCKNLLRNFPEYSTTTV